MCAFACDVALLLCKEALFACYVLCLWLEAMGPCLQLTLCAVPCIRLYCRAHDQQVLLLFVCVLCNSQQSQRSTPPPPPPQCAVMQAKCEDGHVLTGIPFVDKGS